MEVEDRGQDYCGTCRHCSPDPIMHDWACFNEESEYYSMFTDYNDACDGYEERG